MGEGAAKRSLSPGSYLGQLLRLCGHLLGIWHRVCGCATNSGIAQEEVAASMCRQVAESVKSTGRTIAGDYRDSIEWMTLPAVGFRS
jgi:hypothetical protein